MMFTIHVDCIKFYFFLDARFIEHCMGNFSLKNAIMYVIWISDLVAIREVVA